MTREARRIRLTVDRQGFRQACRNYGEAAVSRAMPARVHHRKYVRKLKPECVERAQAKAREAAEQAHPTASPLVGE